MAVRTFVLLSSILNTAMLKIAVDAMGGDYAPASEVEGAIEAARDLGVGVILVGKSELIQAELDKHRRSRALVGSPRSWRSASRIALAIAAGAAA